MFVFAGVVGEKLEQIGCSIFIPKTQMTHILEDLTHKMEGQPPKKRSVGF